MKCFYIHFSDYGNPVSQLVEYLLVDLYWKLLVHHFVKYRVNIVIYKMILEYSMRRSSDKLQ